MPKYKRMFVYLAYDFECYKMSYVVMYTIAWINRKNEYIQTTYLPEYYICSLCGEPASHARLKP
jgi:hypothetical protein